MNGPGDKKASLSGPIARLAMFSGALAFAFFVFRPTQAPPESVFAEGLQAAEKADWETLDDCVLRLSSIPESAPRAAVLKAFRQKADGDTDQAFLTFSQATDHPDTREIAYHEAAQLLYDQGEFGQVILMCRQVLQWNESRTKTRRLLAAALYDIGAMIQAIEALNIVIEAEPDDFRPYYMKATILHDFERFDDAELTYRAGAKHVTESNVARPEFLAGWADCLVRLRRFDEALKLLDTSNTDTRGLSVKAAALFATRQFDQALSAAEVILMREPFHPDATAVAAQCQELNGNRSQGIEMLQAAISQHPHELELHLRLSELLGAAGRTDEAVNHRERAGQIAEFRRLFSKKQQELVHDDNNADLRFEIGQLAEQLGKIQIAGSWYRAAIGMPTCTDEIRLHWAAFQQKYGQPNDAKGRP